MGRGNGQELATATTLLFGRRRGGTRPLIRRPTLAEQLQPEELLRLADSVTPGPTDPLLAGLSDDAGRTLEAVDVYHSADTWVNRSTQQCRHLRLGIVETDGQ